MLKTIRVTIYKQTMIIRYQRKCRKTPVVERSDRSGLYHVRKNSCFPTLLYMIGLATDP